MRIKFILTYLTLFAIISFAQSKDAIIPFQTGPADTSKTNGSDLASDSVNISQMVLAQIDAARKKQMEEKNQPTKLVETTTVKVQPASSTNFIADWVKSLAISEDTMVKIIIIGSATFIAVIFISFRRLKYSKKYSVKNDLKNGIKLIREEKVFGKKDEKLSSVRNKLAGSPSSYQLSNESVSRNARDLNIAKGEIYLAARIKSHELNQASGGNFVRNKLR